LLSIKNLTVIVNDKQILKGINLKIKAGEIHAIMGPNGSGKSTVSHILPDKNGYTVTSELVTHQTPQRRLSRFYMNMYKRISPKMRCFIKHISMLIWQTVK